MNRLLNCAIIGYGYMGTIRRRVIDHSTKLQLTGIVEPNREKQSQISDIPTYEDFNHLIEQQPHIDIIFICTPNLYAPDLTVKSIEKGIHVFCEKPPGRNLKDIQLMINAEKKHKNTKLMFGFNHRFHPAVMKAKAIFENKNIGEIIGLKGVYGKSGGNNFRNSWRNKKEISGGGILLDQGIHMLDLFRYFCGDFYTIKCFLNNSFWNFEVEDNAYVMLSNNRNQNAFFHSSATLWKHTFYLEIMLEEGYMIIEGLLSKTGSYGRERLTVGKRQFEDQTEAIGNPSEEITYFDQDCSWDLEVEEFVRCIQEDKPIKASSSEDAFKVMEIIEKAYQDADQSAYS